MHKPVYHVLYHTYDRLYEHAHAHINEPVIEQSWGQVKEAIDLMQYVVSQLVLSKIHANE